MLKDEWIKPGRRPGNHGADAAPGLPQFVGLVIVFWAMILCCGHAYAQAEADDAMLEQFGRSLETLLNSGDADQFSAVLSQDQFAEQVMRGIDYGEELPEKLQPILARAVSTAVLFINWEPFTRFKYLGLEERGGRRGLFFRCVHPNGSLNYFTFFAAPAAQSGELKVTDIYNHRGAGYHTRVGQQHLALQAVRQDVLEPAQMSGMPVSLSTYRSLSAMSEALPRGDFPRVIASYNQMSNKGKKLPVAVMFYMAASLHDDAQFAEARRVAEQLIPGELSPDLMMVDRLMNNKKWTEAIARYQEMMSKTQNDPYLHFRMARCYYEMNDYGQAGKAALRAIKAEPDLVDPYLLLMDLEMKKSNFEGAVRMLKLLGNQFNVLVDNEQFETEDIYAGFRESPQYQDWLQYRAKRQQELETQAVAPNVVPR